MVALSVADDESYGGKRSACFFLAFTELLMISASIKW